MKNIFAGERLRAERTRLGFTQAAFAGLAGASARSQIGWEQGKFVPDLSAFVAWGAAGADITYILTGVQLAPDSLAQVTEVLRITAQQEPQGGPLTDKAIAAIHDIGGLAVAEPRAAYAPISPRERALLDNYRAADEAGKKALETTGAALAQPAARQEKHGNV